MMKVYVVIERRFSGDCSPPECYQPIYDNHVVAVFADETVAQNLARSHPRDAFHTEYDVEEHEVR